MFFIRIKCLKGVGVDAVKVNVISALPAAFQQYEEDKRVEAGQLEAVDKLGEKWEDSYFPTNVFFLPAVYP